MKSNNSPHRGAKLNIRRTPLIAGNWKMNGDKEFAKLLSSEIKQLESEQVETVIAPPFTLLSEMHRYLLDTRAGLCAQDVYWEENGAFTGQVSATMLREVGCEYCIVGHSERRQYFGETDTQVRDKLKALFGKEIKPILCVGETLQQREGGEVEEVIQTQLSGALLGLSLKEPSEIVIAYEPVWAIGTGKTASAEDAQKVHVFIRKYLVQKWGKDIGNSIRILYGGSVKPENAQKIMEQSEIDGTLVGGASLKVDSFVSIIQSAIKVIP